MSEALVINKYSDAAFIVNNTTGEIVNAAESDLSE